MPITPLLLVLLAPASAEPLVGHHLAVGVHDDGSLCEDRLGIRFDPSADVAGTPVGNDLLTPGRDFETWSATWSTNTGTHEVVAGGPYLSGGPDVEWAIPQSRPEFAFIEGNTDQDGVRITVAVDLPTTGSHFWVTTTFTASEPVDDLLVARTVDADPDHFINGSYATDNLVDGEVVVSASQRTEGKALALAAVGGRARICSGWCASADAVLRGTVEPTQDDDVIGVVVGPISLAAGETRVVRFAYGLGTSADEAQANARDAMGIDDLDGDGDTVSEGDCDDRNADTFPGAPEIADGLDNDCDNTIDEDTPASDDDGDGYSEIDGDCDDSDDSIYPGAPTQDDVADADCDGLADVDPFADGERPDGWGQEPDPPSACAALPLHHAGLWLALPLLWLRRRS